MPDIIRKSAKIEPWRSQTIEELLRGFHRGDGRSRNCSVVSMEVTEDQGTAPWLHLWGFMLKDSKTRDSKMFCENSHFPQYFK